MFMNVYECLNKERWDTDYISVPLCNLSVKLSAAVFFFNEKHEPTRKIFMASCIDCGNTLFIP